VVKFQKLEQCVKKQIIESCEVHLQEKRAQTKTVLNYVRLRSMPAMNLIFYFVFFSAVRVGVEIRLYQYKKVLFFKQ
jgi:hypothetical protein